MRRYGRRLLRLLLSLALMLAVPFAGLAGAPAIRAQAAGGITRAEWLSRLVETFGMAVEFGVIDMEAGGEVQPDGAVSREFAAHTLNYCLGYQMEEGTAYGFPDASECVYPDDAQVAVTRGWLGLIDGKFSPGTPVTLNQDKDGVIIKKYIPKALTVYFRFRFYLPFIHCLTVPGTKSSV